MGLAWYLFGVLSGAYIFHKKIRHAINSMFVWIFQQLQNLLDKASKNNNDSED